LRIAVEPERDIVGRGRFLWADGAVRGSYGRHAHECRLELYGRRRRLYSLCTTRTGPSSGSVRSRWTTDLHSRGIPQPRVRPSRKVSTSWPFSWPEMRRWCAHGTPPASRLLPLRHSGPRQL